MKERKRRKRRKYAVARVSEEEMVSYQSFDGLKTYVSSARSAPINDTDYDNEGINLKAKLSEKVKFCSVSFLKPKKARNKKRPFVAMGSDEDIEALKAILKEYRSGKRKLKKRKANKNGGTGSPTLKGRTKIRPQYLKE